MTKTSSSSPRVRLADRAESCLVALAVCLLWTLWSGGASANDFSIDLEQALLLVGDSRNLQVTGTFEEPVSWSSSNQEVATVTQGGRLLGVSPGKCVVTAVDAGGRRAVSGVIDVVPIALRLPQETIENALESHRIDIVTELELSGLGIRSLELAFSFDPTVVAVTAIVTDGTLTQSWGPANLHVNDAPEATTSTVAISHAGATALVGSGPLVSIMVRPESRVADGSATELEPLRLLLNEGDPGAVLVGGRLVVEGEPQFVESVSIVAVPHALRPGQTHQFSAIVVASDNTDVSWSVVGGDSDGRFLGNGLFRAPKSVPLPREALIRATSVGDPSVVDELSIQLEPAESDAGPRLWVLPNPARPRRLGIFVLSQSEARYHSFA